MVLSNKKLKQKLRAESAQKQSNSNVVVVVEAPDSSSTSFKQLLDTASHKPRLSKRDVLRKLRSLQPTPEPAAKDEGTNKENGTEDLGSQKKKNSNKKRKVEVKDDDVANGVLSDASESKKQKQNKAKMKSKKLKLKQNKAAENGSNHEEEIPEATVLTKTNPSTSQDNGDDPTKVYVGGIPYYSTEDDIRSYFESCGTITEVECLNFSDSGKFRGIAIISFKTEAAAKRALALDGADMGGLFLTIQPYTTKPSKSARFAPETVEGYNRVYVSNLSWDIKEGELRKFFSNCNITSLRFGMDKETGQFKGYAHVDFGDSQSLKTALTLDQCVLLGRPARVSHAVPLKNVKKNPDGEMLKQGRCFNCHEKGHRDKECPKKIQAVPLTDLQEKPDEKHAAPLTILEEKPAEEPSSSLSNKKKNRRCYNCHEKGHFDSECPQKIHAVPLTDLQEKPDEERAVPSTNSEEKPYEEPRSSLSNKKKNRRCYNCREKGHMDSECPKRPV